MHSEQNISTQTTANTHDPLFFGKAMRNPDRGLNETIITRLTSFFLFFFLIFLKTKSKYVFVSYKSWFTFQNTNILNTCTCLKHIDSALVQPVPVGPYVLSVSCQVKNELYLCIICITFSGHSIYCLVLRLIVLLLVDTTSWLFMINANSFFT